MPSSEVCLFNLHFRNSFQISRRAIYADKIFPGKHPTVLVPRGEGIPDRTSPFFLKLICGLIIPKTYWRIENCFRRLLVAGCLVV